MAAMMVEREPEVARFIDSYKYDQEIAERRSKYGGGTSLPLDSDGYEAKQRRLKEELRNDFLVQQEKDIERPVNMNPYAPKHAPLAQGPQHAADYEREIQKMTDRYHSKYNDVLYDADAEIREPSDPVYYRVGTPEQGLRGLGQYERQRHEMNVLRQREYNDFLRQQKNIEQQRIEARRSRPQPPASQPAGGQVDYIQQNQRARSEDKRAYQDYMGKYHQPNVVTVKPPINYEEDRKRLSEERKQEYEDYVEKKAQEERYWKMRGRPVTPPGGLDIGQYDKHLKEVLPKKKKEYKDMLDQQRNEKLQHKAWERVAEVSPNHMHFRDEDRPLVGSPRDVNFTMHEKEEKDKFGLINRDLKHDSKNNVPMDKTSSYYQYYVQRQVAKRDDENFRRYLELEKEKRKEQKSYREALMKQQKDQMYMRARQEPEMPVLDRAGPQQATYLASKPPPGPQQNYTHATYQPRDEPPNRQTPHYWNDGKREQSPASLLSEGSKQSKAPINRDVPLPFRTDHPKDVARSGELVNGQQLEDRPNINGHYKMDILPQSPEKSPLKYRKTPPPRPRADENQFEDQRQQPMSLDPPPIQNDDTLGYQPSFQHNTVQERPRQTPLAFQTGPSGQEYKLNESILPPSRPKESRQKDSQNRSARPGANQPIGGLYLFDDSKHDNVKRQIHDMRQKDYQDYLQQKQEQERRRQDEARLQRGAPAEMHKDHHYSSDEYEKFQKRLHRQEGEEYREFLKKQYEPKWKVGLPLGQYKYEPKRLLMEHERNTDYNEYAKKSYQPPLNAAGLPLGQYKYEPKRLAMEAERNREYNDFLKTKKNEPPPVDGPQGLNIDVTYQDKKKVFLEKQRNKDYNDLLHKEEDQNGDAMHFHQLDENQKIGMRYNQGYSQVQENQYDQQSYGNQLTPQRPQRSSHQQGSSNMHAVMNHSMYLPPAQVPIQREELPQKMPQQRNGESYIPAPPDYTLDPYRTNPNRFHDQMTAPYPKAASVPAADSGSIPATPNMLSLPVGSYDEARPFIEKERNRQYNDFIAKLPPIKSNRGGMTPHATALTLPIGAYDAARPTFERQRNQEYNHLKQEGKLDPKKRSLRQKAPTPPEQQGIFESQDRYESYIKNMEKQRNKEYNDFLNKKYLKGKMTSRSEPDRQNASFFPGNEDEQDMKKRYLAQERSRQYNQMLREQEPPRSRSVNIPSDVESGLPIGQQHHESWKRFLREQRNKEYNQMIDTTGENRSWSVNIPSESGLPVGLKYRTAWTKFLVERQKQGLNKPLVLKNQEVRNRDWSYGNSGVLDLRGDDQNQSKKQVLREERQKEYKEYMSQTQKKMNRSWPEPDGRGALLVKKGEYDSVRNMYSNERKQELKQYLNDKDQPQQEPQGQFEGRSRSEPPSPSSVSTSNPIVNALGHYNDTRRKLVDDRKKEFQIFMTEKKLHEVPPKRGLAESFPTLAKDEKPLVNSMGLYEDQKRKKFLQERKKDFASFSLDKAKHLTPRSNVKENLMPHVASAETPLVNFMGRYDEEKLKFRVERNKDLREFSQKKAKDHHSPYDNYVYPTVAVAEKPLVDYMGRDVEARRNELRQERRHDYERYQSKQRMKDAPRRHDYYDNKNEPYQGIFSGLGDHGNTKEMLGQQRKQEYLEHLNNYPHPKAQGRPTWVKETIPNNTDRGRSPVKNPPPVDHYQQMLDEKRREEAQRRRFDDPEIQGRLAPSSRDGRYMGERQQNYGGYYPQE